MTNANGVDERLCHRLFLGLDIALVVVDRGMRVLLMNPAAEKIMAVGNRSVAGRPVQ